MVKTGVALIGLMLFTQFVYAEIYRWVDEAGNTQYSDQPHKNAEEVTLPGITSYTSTPVKSTTTTNNEPVVKPERYKSFKISEPANESTIRENSGSVVVSIAIEPSLYRGDTVIYDIDGQVFKLKSTSHGFTDMARGTHVLKVHIVNSQGEPVTPVISSQFYLKRASVLNRKKNTN